MNGLAKRLNALEAIARQARRREVREMIAAIPEAHDLTPAELEASTDEALRVLEVTAAWRRDGMSEREIMRRGAEVYGLSLEAIEAEYRALTPAR